MKRRVVFNIMFEFYLAEKRKTTFLSPNSNNNMILISRTRGVMDETAKKFIPPRASFCAFAGTAVGNRPTDRRTDGCGRGTVAYFRCLVPFLIINKNGVCCVSFGCDSRVSLTCLFALNCRPLISTVNVFRTHHEIPSGCPFLW